MLEEGSDGLDPIRLMRGLVLLVRALEQEMRGARGVDALGLTEIGALGQIERGVDQPTQVARAMRLDPARVTHVMDRLVTRGYATREVDTEDRRRWRLRLTSEGEECLRDGRARLRLATEQVLAKLSADERADLVHGVEGVVRVIGGESGS